MEKLFLLAVLDQPLAKAHRGAFIGHLVMQPQFDEAPIERAVLDLFFALRVGEAVAALSSSF